MLTEANIESELSYAYLHAVATRGGFGCFCTNRHLDDAGVDAQINEDGRALVVDSIRLSFALHVQLKATRQQPAEQNGRFSFALPIKQYDKLRESRLATPRLLVVLYLPADSSDWLRHSEEALISRRCAYWASLRGASASPNDTVQTIYIPKRQLLSVDALTTIMTRCSREEPLAYVP